MPKQKRANGKKIIAIASSGRTAKVGSIFTCMVVLDPTFKRKLPNLPGEFNPKWLMQAKDKIDNYEITIITPNHMHLSVPKLLEEQYGALLNTYENFWKNTEIYFEEDIEPFITSGVRKMGKVDEIKRTVKADAYAVAVAKQFAILHQFKEMQEIKQTYGDYGTGGADDPKTIEFIKKNPKCVWVR